MCYGRLLEDDADQVQGAGGSIPWELRYVLISHVLSFMYLVISRNRHDHRFHVTERVSGGVVFLIAAIADDRLQGAIIHGQFETSEPVQSIGREPLSRALVIR